MGAITRYYRVHFLGVELILAFLLTGGFAFWLFRGEGIAALDPVLKGNRGQIYGALASILGTLLGFVIAAVAIVLTVTEHPRMQLVRGSQHYPTLWRVFNSSMRWLGFGTLIAFAALIIDRDDRTAPVFMVLCVLGVCIAIVRMCRVIWAMTHIVGLATRSD